MSPFKPSSGVYLNHTAQDQLPYYNVNWPNAVVGEAVNGSSVSASAYHIGGPIDVNPGQLTLVYGNKFLVMIDCCSQINANPIPLL